MLREYELKFRTPSFSSRCSGGNIIVGAFIIASVSGPCNLHFEWLLSPANARQSHVSQYDTSDCVALASLRTWAALQVQLETVLNQKVQITAPATDFGMIAHLRLAFARFAECLLLIMRDVDVKVALLSITTPAVPSVQ